MMFCLLICISSFQGIAQIQFEKVLPYASQITADFFGVSESYIAFADVNVDNDQDVLITGLSNSSGKIAQPYTYNCSGNFSIVSGTPFDWVEFGSIAFADIDNDTDQNVLITGSSSQIGIIAKLYRNISVPLSSIENLKADQVRIYPNPFTQASTVELPARSSAHQLRLLNVQGKEVLRRENITQTNIETSHSALSSGLYLLEVQGEWGIKRKKLIRR